MKRPPLSAGFAVATAIVGGIFFVACSSEQEAGQQTTPTNVESSTAQREGNFGSAVQDPQSETPSTLAQGQSDVRESIRRRVKEDQHEFIDPKPPALRSPAGETDPLQCMDPSVDVCDNSSNPLAASSWDEAQWMRARGFVDEQQLANAGVWSDAELDQRYRNGDAAAVLELARRFSAANERAAARRVLSDAVRLGNIRAAHELAKLDYGKSYEWYATPGLEWLFVARRLGDGGVTMTYVMQRYPNTQPAQLDQAMTAADRVFERLNLQAMPTERRPGKL
jgi:hypothetical protein